MEGTSWSSKKLLQSLLKCSKKSRPSTRLKALKIYTYIFNGIHSMQGWTATQGIDLQEREEKDAKHTGKVFRKNKDKRCL